MAETVKHTPGPWEFDGDNAVMANVGAHICTVSMADDFPCLEDDQRADAEAESKANANLIAAAPDLYSLAIELESYFDQRADADMDQDGYVPNEEMRLLVDIRAAIAKAEGRS